MSLRDDLAARLSREYLGPDPDPLDPLAAGVGRALVNRRGSKVRAEKAVEPPQGVAPLPLNGDRLIQHLRAQLQTPAAPPSQSDGTR